MLTKTVELVLLNLATLSGYAKLWRSGVGGDGVFLELEINHPVFINQTIFCLTKSEQFFLFHKLTKINTFCETLKHNKNNLYSCCTNIV